MTALRLLALALPLALAGCFGSSDAPLQGYVEGTYVYMSPETGGRIVTRPVVAGVRVAAGDTLFTLDDADQTEALAGAEARLAQAKAQLANLETGQRPEEIAVLEAAVASARSTFTNLDEQYRRQLMLIEKGVVPQSTVDTAKSARDAADAAVVQAERQLDVAKLPARPEEIEAAKRNVRAEEASVAQADIALQRRHVMAPSAGLVEDTFYEVGELVPAGQPVVSLLPDENRKVRFFVPEATLSTIGPGTSVNVGCDGCPAGLTATVDFVSTEAEFTPPVIYSRDSREKLVFRVEARPDGDATALKVGQPVDVTIGSR